MSKSLSGDAEQMLKKALEEMDDIFRDSNEPVTFHSNSIPRTIRNKNIPVEIPFRNNNEFQGDDMTLNLIKILEDLNQRLKVNRIEFDSGDLQTHSVHSYCNTSLSEVSKLFQKFGEKKQVYHHQQQNTPSLNEGSQETIHRLEREKQSYLEETRKLHSQLLYNESELEKTKKTLGEYARKNEELLIRMTGQRLNEQKKQKANHNRLLLDDEDHEMDRLKNHIDGLLDEQEKRKSTSSEGDDSIIMLKTRLREKASECNRLKMQLEELKLLQETKDNTLLKIQDQVKHLFQENESLRQRLANPDEIHSNGNHTPMLNHTERMIPNGSLPRTPDLSMSPVKKPYSFSSSILQMKSLKSASEPNLIQNERRTIGLPTPATLSTAGDESVYRPYKRMISDSPFSTWACDQVQDWLRDEGLEEYTKPCSEHIRKGEDLLKYTYVEYEKILGMTDPLHRKKLNLALKAVTSNSPDYAGRLDHHWVVRWLDDLGLPQYRQAFFQHKIDGRMLINMTLDDILQLKMFNLLHHISLKRSIQFLRHQKFHPQYLREVANQSEERCDHVMLWTNQRIQHWLRSVDLAEYAPNLRGSGVNGGVMVLEPRFNADTLATLLSIPNNKGLIRKHVASQFMTLLGEGCQRQKDMTQKTSDFVPLNGSDKHKLRPKKGINFGSLRRRKSETDLESLLCPLELDVSNIYSPPPALDPEVIFDMSESASLSPSFTNDNASESTNETSNGVPHIADLSQEIENMTSMLGNDHKY